MKRASRSIDQSHATDVEAVEKLKYQTLLKEYLELQKAYVSRKRKLQAAKRKRELSVAEVRFLKRKHKYLLKNQASIDKERSSPCGKMKGVIVSSVKERASGRSSHSQCLVIKL